MASASAVGSGKRCSMRRSGGVPRRAKARSWVTTRRASPAARPRAASWSASAAARRRRTNRTASRPSTGGSSERPRSIRSGARRGRKRSVSSPWACAWSLRPLVAEARDQRGSRQLRHRSRSSAGRTGQAGPDVRRRGSAGRPGRARGTGRRRRAGRGPAGRPPSAWAAATEAAKRGARDPGLRRAGQDRRERVGHPRDQHLLDAPQPDQAVDVDGDPAERRVGDVARAGDARAERWRAARRRPRGRPGPASGARSRKVASGASRWALPSGIPRRTPRARASGSASTTVPSVQGWPPRTIGPGGHEAEVPSGDGVSALAFARRRGR